MGSSGGGGSASMPGHLLKIHEDWLVREVDGEPLHEIDVTMVESMNEALGPGGNPFSQMTVFDPNPALDEIRQQIEAFKHEIEGLDTDTLDIDAIGERLSRSALNRIEATTLNRFHRGMQNINAVNTTAFVIGRAVIYGFAQDSIDQTTGSIMANHQQWQNQMRSSLLHYGIETERMRIAANVDRDSQTNQILEAELRWPMEIFQYGANLLSASMGGTSPVGTAKASAAQSTIGGGLQGAAIGAQLGASSGTPFGVGLGAGVGALIGAIGGNLAS